MQCEVDCCCCCCSGILRSWMLWMHHHRTDWVSTARCIAAVVVVAVVAAVVVCLIHLFVDANCPPIVAVVLLWLPILGCRVYWLPERTRTTTQSWTIVTKMFRATRILFPFYCPIHWVEFYNLRLGMYRWWLLDDVHAIVWTKKHAANDPR